MKRKETKKEWPPLECETCPWYPYSMFQDLNREQLEQLSMEKEPRFFKRGDVIFEAGHPPRGMYCIYKGKAKLVKQEHTDHEMIVRIASEGDVLGYRSILGNTPYSATAIALTDMVTCYIPLSLVNKLIESNHKTALRFLRRLAKDLGEAESRMVSIAYSPVKERIARILLMLQKIYGTDDNGYINLELSREELASLAGTVVETAIRNLSNLEKEGYIEVNKRKIKILNKDKLAFLGNITD